VKLSVAIRHYLKRAANLPLHIAVFRAGRFAWRKLGDGVGASRDAWSQTYLAENLAPPGDMRRLLVALPADESRTIPPALAATCGHFLAHRFDRLGSGWIEVAHGTKCRGLVGIQYPRGEAVEADAAGQWLDGRVTQANRKRATDTWRLISDAGGAYSGSGDYSPIDWHLDFVSGYRWRERTWYRNVPYAHLEGVDVKVPWELSRMQHLPQLALAFALSGPDASRDRTNEEGDELCTLRQEYLSEIRNQILDFIAGNPPRYGVNWRCTMDVAIRVSNWVLAVDLARAAGANLDAAFLTALKASVFQHGRHIYANLERPKGLTGNHYLANLVGLLFVSSFLPRSPEVDEWLAFSIREMESEVKRQFQRDGGHFEGSTAYHRLSAEMVAWGTSLALRAASGGPTEYVRHAWAAPDWYVERLRGMRDLLVDATRPDGSPVLFGDNDSGSFIKVLPRYQELSPEEARSRYLNLEGYEGEDGISYWLEMTTDTGPTIALLDGLLNEGSDGRIETALIKGLMGDVDPLEERTSGENRPLPIVPTPTREPQSRGGYGPFVFEFRTQGENLWEGLTTTVYSDFGLTVYRSKRAYLAIRCGPVPTLAQAAHGHDDQLSMEFFVDGAALVVDPGVFVYTPLPSSHRWFRSSWVHGLPRRVDAATDSRPEGETMIGEGRVLRCDPAGFVGEVEGPGGSRYRRFDLREGCLRISDTLPFGSAATQFTLGPDCMASIEGDLAVIRTSTGSVVEFVAETGECRLGESMLAHGYGWLRRTSVLRWSNLPPGEGRWPEPRVPFP
jgi:hypothetical protein